GPPRVLRSFPTRRSSDLLASGVEAVEAVTIVLAMGSTRSWSSALSGAGAAGLVLVAITAGLGPAVTSLPIDTLRLVVGGLLLVLDRKSTRLNSSHSQISY